MAKHSDYILFKQCINIIKNNEHLTDEGLLKLVGIKASLNLGLTDTLKESFPKFVPVARPDFNFKGVTDPNWIAGFASGDGSFHLKIANSATKIGKSVQLNFAIHLHLRETPVIKGLAKYFELNTVRENNLLNDSNSSEGKEVKSKNIYFTPNSVALQIAKYSDLTQKIIPFFEKYPIVGRKSLDFADFKKVAELMQNKEHLTLDGLEKILKIQEGMNLRRKF
jgi:hypothetical protein